MLTILSFALGLGLLVAVHEYGHYRMARACGVRVIRFSVGFGKPLVAWRFKPHGTEFVVAMVPLGGFVKMLDEREGPVSPDLRHLAFNTQPLYRRALIVLAGPVANLLLAVSIYAGIAWWGVPQAKPLLGTPVAGSVAEAAGIRTGDWVVAAQVTGDEPSAVLSFDQLRWILTQAALSGDDVVLSLADGEGSPAVRTVSMLLSALDAREADAHLFRAIGLLGPLAAPLVTKVVPGGAGELAGVREGDLVRKLDDQAVMDAQQLRDLIRQSIQSPGRAVAQVWTVERDGHLLQIPVTPRPERQDGVWSGKAGVYLGAPPVMQVVRWGVLEGLVEGISKTWEMSAVTIKMMVKMLTGDASIKNLSGPISIADHAGKSATHGFVSYAMFLAVISVSLGVLNLLPIPILDGGHLMYYLYEAFTGREPAAIWMDRFQRVGMTFLMSMMTVALFNDVARLLG